MLRDAGMRVACAKAGPGYFGPDSSDAMMTSLFVNPDARSLPQR